MSDWASELMDRLSSQVKRNILPEQAAAGDSVGGISEPRVRVNDPREGGNLTGSYSPSMISTIVNSAKQHKVDPALALSIALQETTLGNSSDFSRQNPLHENTINTHKSNTQALVHNQSKFNSHMDAIKALALNNSLDQSLKHLKSLLNLHSGEPEERQIQAYNGLGKPDIHYSMYGVNDPSKLESNFYGKRIQDIRDNVVNKSPLFQQYIKD